MKTRVPPWWWKWPPLLPDDECPRPPDLPPASASIGNSVAAARKTTASVTTRMARRIALRSELEALDLACRRLRQVAAELDPARIFVRREPALDVVLQRLLQRI